MIERNKSNIVNFEMSADRLLNIAYKKIDKSDYLNALPILKRALVEEPLNVDILLELATIYSKLNIIDKSNKYAYEALKAEHNETSLYVIGGNFLKTHNYDAGVAYYKRLLDMYPDGEYADYVDMVVEHIEDEETTGKELKLLRLTQRGREYMDKGLYKKAIRLFHLLSLAEPDRVYIKNNLAMAYFHDNQIDMAIKTCKGVLTEHKYDIYTNCSLALFFYRLKSKLELKAQLLRLKKLIPSTQEEFMKLITTYCELKLHEDVIKTVKKAAMTFSYDITYMFFLAAANYNIGNVNKALSIYRDILKADEFNFVAHYYIKAINSIMPPVEIDYYNQIPMVAIIDSVKRLKSLMETKQDELKIVFTSDDRMVVAWGLKYKDDAVKRICINLLERLGDSKSKEMLLDELFSFSMGDDIKKEVLASLRMLGVKQPYSAYFAGDISDVNVSVTALNEETDLVRPQKAIDMFQEHAADDFSDELIKECVDMYIMTLNAGIEKEFKSLNAFCAVIETAVRDFFELEYGKDEVISRYHTTKDTFEKYKERLTELLMELNSKDKYDEKQ